MVALITRYPIDVDLAKASDNIDVQAKATGALAAGAFPELDTFASTIFTAGGVKWLKAASAGTTAGPYTAKTKHDAFDQEVTTYTRSGSITLRYANGIGLMLQWGVSAADTNGSLIIGRVAGIDDTQPVYPATGYPFTDVIYQTSTLVSTFGVVKANYATDTLTFGVSGFDLYVKYNGVTLDIPALKGSAWRVMQPGKILFSARPVIGDPEGTAGFRNIAISYPAKPSTRRSNMTGKVIDLTDYGIKHLETTGSITAASNQLTVASAAGFAVGDQIIVAVGGETALSSIYSNTAAAGRRGTIGVGGTWPIAARLYADQATRLAASPADESYGELDTGKVYLRFGGAWVAWESTYYYWNMICPQPLVAKITAIAGNVLTLDKNAVATTANAQVCYDCLPCFKALTDSCTISSVPASPAVYVPMSPVNGAFYISGPIQTSYRNGLKLRGHTRDTSKLRSPKGVNWKCFDSSEAKDVVVSDLWYVSNHDVHGYGVLSRGDIGGGFNISGKNTVFATGCRMERIRATDVPSQSFRTSFTDDCVIDNNLIEPTKPEQCYLQWQINGVNSNRPIISNNYIDSPTLVHGLEVFACQDGQIVNSGGRNIMLSSNSCDGTIMDGIYSIVEQNCRATNVADPINDASILQFNSNVGNTSGGSNGIPGLGGTILYPRIIIQGYMSAADNWVSQAINITGNANLLIDGTHDPLVADDGQRKGLIQAPPRIVSGLGSATFANKGPKINSDSLNTVVRGMRIQAISATPYGNGVAASIPDTANQIDLYYGSTSTVSGIAALGTGTGSVTLSSVTAWAGSGVMKIGSELLEYTITNAGTRTVSITSRGFGGTTPATYADGVSATGVDYSKIENCIVDVPRIASTYGTKTGNITNAAYAAL